MSGTALLVGSLGALGLAIAMFTVIVLPARSGPHGVAQALTAIEARYSQRSPAGAPEAGPLTVLPGWLRGLAVRLSPGAATASLQHRLDLAGNPRRWTPDRLLAVKGLGLIVLTALGALYGLHDVGLLLLATVAGGSIGFFLPDLLLYNARLKWQAHLQRALPDALDMLTVCVEAGLGFDAALAQVARNTEGPLAAEFARVLQEMQIGQSRSEALRSLAARTTVSPLRAFVSALVQAGELGIPIARVLREQSHEMRLRRRQRAEEKAQQVPVKITFPLIACIFPALLVVVIGPGVIEIAQSLFHRL